MQHFTQRSSRERRTAREHLEQKRARRKEIGAGVDGIAGHLFGGHVPRCPQSDSCAGQLCLGHRRLRQLGPREAEVEELHAMRRDEHVRRLEIAVDDAAGVQRRERRENPEADGHCLSHAHRSATEALRQRLALEELHGDEQLAAFLADFIDLTDVRMIDARGRSRFPPEPPASCVVVCQRRHGLERDGPLEPLVPRRVHHAHAAFAELACDCVVTDASRSAFAARGGLRIRK